MFITENGWSDRGGIEDFERISYYHDHLQNVLGAVNDGCNVKGYTGIDIKKLWQYIFSQRSNHFTAWALIDNFEWAFGYT